jgi:hypothetical protein
VFVAVSHFHLSLIFASKAGAYLCEVPMSGAFLENLRLRWERVTGTNTIAYYSTELITAVKSSMKLAPGACNMKRFNE